MEKKLKYVKPDTVFINLRTEGLLENQGGIGYSPTPVIDFDAKPYKDFSEEDWNTGGDETTGGNVGLPHNTNPWND